MATLLILRITGDFEYEETERLSQRPHLQGSREATLRSYAQIPIYRSRGSSDLGDRLVILHRDHLQNQCLREGDRCSYGAVFFGCLP